MNEDALFALSTALQEKHPVEVLDLRTGLQTTMVDQSQGKIKTVEGEITVTVPVDDEEEAQ